jgi:aromatic ring hydroxylase-like protein
MAAKWADRIGTFRCRCYERPANLDALLGRPNGYVAGAAEADDRDEESQSALSTALERWFGAASR